MNYSEAVMTHTAQLDEYLGLHLEAGEEYTEWLLHAQCRTFDPDILFVEGRHQREAARHCDGCPVKARCLAEALNSETDYGVWGGMTSRQRRSLRRAYPKVSDWRAYISEHVRAGGNLASL